MEEIKLEEPIHKVEFRVLEGSPILKFENVGKLQEKFHVWIRHKHNPIASLNNKIILKSEDKIYPNEFIKIEGSFDDVKAFMMMAATLGR